MSKSEQLGLSSSIYLEVVRIQTVNTTYLLAEKKTNNNTSNIQGHNIGPMKIFKNWMPNERSGIIFDRYKLISLKAENQKRDIQSNQRTDGRTRSYGVTLFRLETIGSLVFR